MTRWTFKRFFHPCFRKVRHDTLTAARKAGQERLNARPGLHLWAYKCPFGNDHWHLTSHPGEQAVPVGTAARERAR